MTKGVNGDTKPEEERNRTAAKALILLVTATIALASIRPASFNFPAIGLDPSWTIAALYAARHHLSFGSDFVFTSGPLSPLYTQLFPLEFTPLVVTLGVLWTFVFASLLYKVSLHLLRANGRLTVIYTITLFLFSQLLFRDGLMIFLPYAASILFLRDKIGTTLLVLAIIVTAAFSAAKFSFFVFALPAFAILDVASLYRAKIPYKSTLFVTSLLLLFLATGQHPSSLFDYIKSAFDIVGSYSAAMSLETKGVELGLWLLVALSLVYLSMKADASSRLFFICETVLLCGYLLSLLKAGFVRNDGHTAIAWTGVFLALPIVVATAPTSPLNLLRSFVSLTIPLIFLFKIGGAHLIALNSYRLATSVTSDLADISNIVIHPDRWMDHMTSKFQLAEQQISARSSIPALSGSVDIIPSRQSELIAKGLNYQPRPTVQEYTAYSSALIQRDRDFFESARAPDYILFAPGSIDNRHPASAEGALWPLLLRLYAPVGGTQNLLTLQKRLTPLGEILNVPTFVKSNFGQTVDVPASPAIIFVKIDVEYTLAGRLLAAFFKPPLIWLHITYQYQTTKDFRLIPAMAREGAILVPTIETADDFSRLYKDSNLNTLNRPVTFRLKVGKLGSWAYQKAVQFSFSGVNLNSVAGVPK